MRGADPLASPSTRIFAVIVLYGQRASDSLTLRTLKRALAHPDAALCQGLIYDNTPAFNTPSRNTPGDNDAADRGAGRSAPAHELPEGFHYQAAPRNRGLLGAYKAALQHARDGGFEWLLTLDQDTSLPAEFFSAMQPGLAAARADGRIAAIVPHLADGDQLLSPAYVGVGRARPVPREFGGIPSREAHAFNSAALLRIAAIEDIGGFHPCFWLDHLDSWLHHALFARGWRMHVLRSLVLEHHFSLLDYKERVSTTRYRNFIAAESSYHDLCGSWFERAAYTARLGVRLANQIRRSESAEICAATRDTWIARLTVPRRRRLRDWRRETNCNEGAREDEA